jgi:hypothetical protein
MMIQAMNEAYIYLMTENLDKAGPLDQSLQSKPRTHVPHLRKFPYINQGKLFAFTTGSVAPMGSLHLAISNLGSME